MSNCLITKQGIRHDTIGVQHNIYCRRVLKKSLKTFLADGGVRVKVFHECIAVEAGQPLSAVQRRVIGRILKDNDYYALTLSVGGFWANKETFIPIRRI